MSDKFVSVVIPVYNEAGVMHDVIMQIREAVSGINYEIIVVNDGSTDKTGEVLKDAPQDTIVIAHKRNKGYGAALKTGIRKAKYSNILIIDADGSYPAEAIPELINHLEENDMVVGARKLSVNLRTPARWFIKKLAAILTGVKIPDLNSGMRAMKKEVVERFIHLLPDKFSFTSTITVAFLANGYDVEYIPINYKKRAGKSKISPISDTLNFIQLVIRMVLYFNPLKIFLPMSISLILLGAGVLFYRFLFGQRVMNVTTTVLILSGFQMFAIGLLADLINKKLNK